MTTPRILLLEDELQLARIVSETLGHRGFMVTHVNNGQSGLDAVGESVFDLCIVDVMMPLVDGFTFVKEIRKSNGNIPVLFLTALSKDNDVIAGYHSGGNDYLKKPFSLEELILRIHELLRRTHGTESTDPIAIGRFHFFVARQELISNAQAITKLSYKESELLHLLVQHKNQLLERKTALLKLWGDDSSFNARTMDVFITKLRKHLQADESIEIINVRGHGYKLLVG